MTWLAAGIGYSVVYLAVAWALELLPAALVWFRAVALLLPPAAGIFVIVRRRHAWTGCHWLFWVTILLGLSFSALAQLGWTVEQHLLGRPTSWLGWYVVFALFGGAAPLLALLTQPHRGPRERVAATTSVDIAGIAVITGFLYASLVVTPALASGERLSPALILLSPLEQLVVLIGLAAASITARGSAWATTYRRLALGQAVACAMLTLSTIEQWQASYRTAGLFDLVWILPFAFYPWAASTAPASDEMRARDDDDVPSRPWVIFAGLALIPVLDSGLKLLNPGRGGAGVPDLTMAVTVVSVLPLLMARLVVERDAVREIGAELQVTDAKRQLLATAVERADELISIIGTDRTLEHANDAFCRALNVEPGDLRGTNAQVWFSDEAQEVCEEAMREAADAGLWRGILSRRRADGSCFSVAATVVPLRHTEGVVDHFVFVERDLTEDTRLRGQLIHSERLAAVGQLVSGIAHEINNPLQSVLGFSELLIESAQSEQDRRDLEQIRFEANRASKIIRNLSVFARRSTAGRSPYDLTELLRATVELRSFALRNANIALVEDYNDVLPPVRVNPEEIQQVLLNLILNAEQAMGGARHGGTLTVRTRHDDAHDAVVLDVIDDGPGIPPELAGRIFEPFFSTKEVGEGTGLGLSIAYGIVQAHGGRLSLEPSPAGACFRVTLPVSRAAQPVDAPSDGSLIDAVSSA